MIKVIFEGSIFLHQKIGGVSKYIKNLNYGLSKYSIKSKIFSPITINENLRKKNSNEISYIKLKKIPKFFTRFFYLINDLFTLIYIKIYKPDLIHFSYYNNFLLKFIDTPYVLTIYDLIHEKLKLKQTKFDKSKLILKASHIICISNQTKKELIKYYKIKSEKITVIHLGVEQKTYKKNKKNKTILFVGSRERYKNFNNFIKAFSGSKFLTSNFKVICFGNNPFTNKELKLFEKLKIKEKIYFVSGNDKKLNDYYQSANLFVTTSFHEGFGLTPLEAMRMSCPVVCSDLPVFREILKDSCQYANPYDPKNIKLKIETVLKSKNKQKDLIKKGHRIIKKFKWDDCCYKTSKIYKNILK